MPALEVETCNRALALLACRQISTLNGESAEQLTCARLYPMVVEDVLSRYRWRFASKIVALELVGAEPLARYASKYQLPAGVHTVWAVLVNDSVIEFDRFENHVYCDAQVTETVHAEVMFTPAQSRWPPYFDSLITLQLASAMAMPLTSNETLAQIYENRAARQFSMAKTLDAQTRTARKIDAVGGLRRYHGGGIGRTFRA